MIGSIELILGPMFAGKSSELLRRVRRFQHIGKSCFLVKSSLDSRYGSNGFITTHDQLQMEGRRLRHLSDLDPKIIQGVDIFGIDEGQFFEDVRELLSQIAQAADNLAGKGKKVIISALDGTYERKPFPHISALFPLAQRITKLQALCLCGAQASFSKRLVPNSETILIGGDDTYRPVCRKCYFE